MRGTEYKIRDIQEGDDPYLEHIIKSIFHEFGLPLTQSTYEDKDTSNMYEGFQEPGAHYFVIEQSGSYLGGAGIKHLNKAEPSVCELQKMYLVPEARGFGYGRILLDRCIEKARELGYKHMYLESASQLKSAIAMYEQNGFRYLDKPLGQTGHYACGVWMLKAL